MTFKAWLGKPTRGTRDREFCAGCGQEIDPETCGCGDSIDHYPDGHSPIPMGCECGRDLGIDDDDE